MGIVNIENESLNRISPVKKDSISPNLTQKVIEEVSEENFSQSAASMKRDKKVAFLADQENNNVSSNPSSKPPTGKVSKAGLEDGGSGKA
jgi:hypothetical protein